MSTYAIRYRLDGPGPAAFIVECDGRFHLYTRGALGAVIPDQSLTAMLACGGYRWVPASGELIFTPRHSLNRSEAPLSVVGAGLTTSDATTLGEVSSPIFA